MDGEKITKKKVIAIVITIGIVAFGAGILFSGSDYYEDDLSSSNQTADADNCNVVVFSIKGYLSTFAIKQPPEQEVDVSSSEDLMSGILFAENDHQTKAVMVLIDSGGGDGVAGEEIANTLKSLSKPNVAVIRTMGASSAYWASTGADKIYASKISDVGGIGITSSYLDQSSKDAKDGYKYIELTSAKYKDLGDPSKPLVAEEKAILLADLKKAHNVFVEEVAQNRNLEVANVSKIANGLTFVGLDALNYGLIDEIGDMTSAIKYLEEQIGEKVEFCWY